MNELALFAGAGGGILGGHLLGWRTVCAVEWESYPASVLCARQSVVWTETGGRENPNLSPAQLNATWVEWLMGWPLGWTDLKPLATDKSHCVQQPHGES